MFRIKICGVTRPDDAVAAARLGADCLGLNFYPPSPRCVDRHVAEQIASVVPADVALVGVYVDADVETIRRDAQRFGLGWAQLHGAESPEQISELAPLRCIKAFRIDQRGMAPVLEFLAECDALGRRPDAVLLDAYRPGAPGGTGTTFDWSVVRRTHGNAPTGRSAAPTELPPIVLAGGLTPENVAEAIAGVHPAAVDTASGVESAPGIKDHEKVGRFITAARRAWRSLEQG